jgi:hypothetical protein
VTLLGAEMALRGELVAEVVERVFLAVGVGAECGLGSGEQIVEVAEGVASRRRRRVTSADKSGIVSSARPSLSMTAAAVSWRLATS